MQASTRLKQHVEVMDAACSKIRMEVSQRCDLLRRSNATTTTVIITFRAYRLTLLSTTLVVFAILRVSANPTRRVKMIPLNRRLQLKRKFAKGARRLV